MNLYLSLIVLVTSSFLGCCKKTIKNENSTGKSDSAFADIYEGEVSDGIIRLPLNTSTENIADSIREQLRYLQGQFAYVGVGIKLPSVKINILDNRSDKQFLEVKYNASLILTLPKVGTYEDYANSVVTTKTLAGVVPANPTEKEKFYKSFSQDCSAQNSTLEKFWYYFQPAVTDNKVPGDFSSPVIRKCPIYAVLSKNDLSSYVTATNDIDIAKLIFKIKPSLTKTDNKKPEYAKILQQGNSIEATIIIGINGGEKNEDPGYLSYEETIKGLNAYFGNSKLNPIDLTGMDRYEVISKNLFITQMYEKNSKIVKLNLFLIDELTQSNFETRYVEAVAKSDLVIYSTHSGLGKNIDKLVQMTSFEKGHYAVFVANGCSTLSYLSDALSKKVAQKNPGDNATKYLDIVVNSLPSPSMASGQTHITWIKSLFEGQATFKEILSKIDQEAHASVWGEEDNPAF